MMKYTRREARAIIALITVLAIALIIMALSRLKDAHSVPGADASTAPVDSVAAPSDSVTAHPDTVVIVTDKPEPKAARKKGKDKKPGKHSPPPPQSSPLDMSVPSI